MKPYVRPISNAWWLKHPHYLRFMLREFSAVFIAAYVIIFLVMILRISQGQAAYEAFWAYLQSPLAILFHAVALAFALLHTISWFQLTPKAMAVWKGEERVPPAMLIIPNYVAWVVLSGVVAWIVLGG